MAVRVLVVDDSGFFRRRVTEMLSADPRLEVVGSAADGREAIAQAQKLKPDVITMDIEMPVMDGITAVRRIMAIRPVPILMFSSLTHEGAQATFEALEAGAVDYLPKNFEDISRNRDEVARILRTRVWSIGARGLPRQVAGAAAVAASAAPARTTAPPPRPSVRSVRGKFQVVAIGTSTGGPVALQQVLAELPGNFPLPLVLVQHMPGSFTSAFARRLDQLCAIKVKEAAEGDELEPGCALLAPGGKQMLIERRGERLRVHIAESTPEQNYRPCVDVTFGSLAKAVPGHTLAVVLTGMGADGREGARLLKEGGSAIWAQDEATSVIYGMPAAIAQAGLADQILALPEVAHRITETV